MQSTIGTPQPLNKALQGLTMCFKNGKGGSGADPEDIRLATYELFMLLFALIK